MDYYLYKRVLTARFILEGRFCNIPAILIGSFLCGYALFGAVSYGWHAVGRGRN